MTPRKPYGSLFVPEGAITPHNQDSKAYRREYVAFRKANDPQFVIQRNRTQRLRRRKKAA